MYRLVLNAGTANETDTGWMDNIITDQGLDAFATPTVLGNWLAYASVGTGTTTPVAGDVALVTPLASTNNVVNTGSSNTGSPNYYGRLDRSWTFAQGAVVGNIAEMGVGTSSGGTGLFSRARIVDGTGTPTTLTVTAIDQLTVYYRIQITPDLTDSSGTVTISAVGYPWTSRIGACSSFGSNLSNLTGQSGIALVRYVIPYAAGASLGAITGTLSGTIGTGVVNGAYSAYTPGSLYQDYTLSYTTSQMNVSGGIGGLVVNIGNSTNYWQAYQFVFSTPIPKDATKTMTLVMRTSWSR